MANKDALIGKVGSFTHELDSIEACWNHFLVAKVCRNQYFDGWILLNPIKSPFWFKQFHVESMSITLREAWSWAPWIKSWQCMLFCQWKWSWTQSLPHVGQTTHHLYPFVSFAIHDCVNTDLVASCRAIWLASGSSFKLCSLFYLGQPLKEILWTTARYWSLGAARDFPSTGGHCVLHDPIWKCTRQTWTKAERFDKRNVMGDGWRWDHFHHIFLYVSLFIIYFFFPLKATGVLMDSIIFCPVLSAWT